MPSTAVQWLNQFEFEDAILRSGQVRKPVLLDFHDPACKGCQRLDEQVYSAPSIVGAITDQAIPVRIVVTGVDAVSTGIINAYISISTPSIQLLSPQRTVYHYFRGCPRLTVLCARQIAQGKHRVYRESVGHLSPELFLTQLSLGLGKRALQLEQLAFGSKLFQQVIAEGRDDEAAGEARFWQSVVRSRAAVPGAALPEVQV